MPSVNRYDKLIFHCFCYTKILFSELDILPYALTLLVGLFVKPEMGMIVGTVSHLCILLYSSGNPKVSIKKETVRK